MGTVVWGRTSSTVGVKSPGRRAMAARAVASIVARAYGRPGPGASGESLVRAPEGRVLLAQRRAGGALAEVLEAQRRPVPARAQFAQGGEHQALHGPDEQRLGRDRLAAQLLEVDRARRPAALHEVADVLRPQAAEAGREVPLAGQRELAEQPLGVERVRIRQ